MAWAQEVRHGIRVLGRNPGFTALAAAALALGIGANTAIFSVVHTVLLRPLPYPDTGRLFFVWQEYPKRNWAPHTPFSHPNFRDVRERAQSFEALHGLTPVERNFAGGGEPERVGGLRVSAGLLSMLGAQPLLGRLFRAEEESPGAGQVVLLSDGLWRRRFGADSGVIGQTVALDGAPYTVIGVLPASFRFPPMYLKSDFWIPLDIDPDQAGRGNRFLMVVGRLKPGVAPGQARAELATIARQLEQENPGPNTGLETSLVPMSEQFRALTRVPLLVLSAAVAFVLLIACANVANMLLAKTASRKKELTIRQALGAGRGQIAKQIVVESLLLAGVGGLAGLGLAAWGVEVLEAVIAKFVPAAPAIGIQWPVLMFAGGIIVCTGLAAGVAPALRACGTELHESLREGSRASGGGPGGALSRQALVACEISLAVVLLVGVGLMLRSLQKLLDVHPGFRPEALLTVHSALPADYQDPARQSAYYRELMERVRSLPGVGSVGAVNRLPLAGQDSDAGLNIEGRTPSPNERPHASLRTTDSEYFQVMGIPLIRGRLFTPQDVSGQPSVAVLNQAAVRRFFPEEDPIGRRIQPDLLAGIWLTVVGVVGDVKHTGLGAESKPEVYWPSLAPFNRSMTVVVRTETDPLQLAPAVRAEARAIDEKLPAPEIDSMANVLSDSLAAPRIMTRLLGLFAGSALLLAAVGIYGVVSYQVARRTREIGIRMAMGADRRRVLRMILIEGLQVAGAGAAAGLAAALGLSRFLRSQLFEVSPFDPVTYAAVTAVLMGTALLATYLPARRAAGVDPLRALRME